MADQDVETREIDWASLVLAADGEEFFKPPNAYEFQGGRVFKDKGSDSAIYNPEPIE